MELKAVPGGKTGSKPGIPLKFSYLSNKSTELLFNRLQKTPLEPTTALKILNYIDGLSQATTQFNKTYTEIMVELSDKDDEGKPIMVDGKYKVETQQAKAQEQVKALLNTEFYLYEHLLTTKELSEIKACPLELEALRPLIWDKV